VKNVTVINTLKNKIRIPIGAKTISIESPDKKAISDTSTAGNRGIKKLILLKSDLYFIYYLAVFLGRNSRLNFLLTLII
jgi:hypothetical protein